MNDEYGPRTLRGRFTKGHPAPSGDNHPSYQGGRIEHEDGSILVLKPNHPRASVGNGRYVREHILVAERALGKSLPEGAQVHHVNGDRSDNRPENLVVCEDDAYHKLLHRRQRALEAAGDPSYLKCTFCKKYDDPESEGFTARPKHGQHYHKDCAAEYRREQRASNSNQNQEEQCQKER